MKPIRIGITLALSLGWMAPFGWSLHIILTFLQTVLWPQARWGLEYTDSDYIFFHIQWVLYPSMLWAFISASFWVCQSFRR